MVGPGEGRQSQHPRRFITSLSTHVGMGCARWTYEPKEATNHPEGMGIVFFLFVINKQDPTDEDEVLLICQRFVSA